jgi:hypothetical protein
MQYRYAENVGDIFVTADSIPVKTKPESNSNKTSTNRLLHLIVTSSYLMFNMSN